MCRWCWIFVAFSSSFLCTAGLSCFKCTQRLPGLEFCVNATKEDCTVVFPTQDSVCLKTVQKFASGQPPWVFAQCQIMQAFSAEQIDSCQVTKGEGGLPGGSGANKSEDQFVTCTCTTDSCNSAPVLLSFSSWPFLLMVMMQLKHLF